MRQTAGLIAWVYGIFPYHHFHSIAHEVLGIAAGGAQVALGGPAGRTLTLKAGDVVVIPAGVAHRNVGKSGPLAVVGAYPGGADWDVRHGDPGDDESVAKAAASVSPLVKDPVWGRSGALQKFWSE